MRKQYEAQQGCALPHTGALHDMGSCVSHKTTILKKVVFEKRDPAEVARECNHSQAAVDHYLKDYHRVKTLYTLNPDVEFIRPCNLCPHMKRITLPKILASLQELKYEVEVDAAVAARAYDAVNSMLELSGGPRA